MVFLQEGEHVVQKLMGIYKNKIRPRGKKILIGLLIFFAVLRTMRRSFLPSGMSARKFCWKALGLGLVIVGPSSRL